MYNFELFFIYLVKVSNGSVSGTEVDTNDSVRFAHSRRGFCINTKIEIEANQKNIFGKRYLNFSSALIGSS